MESGTPGVKSTDGGWLNRALVGLPDPQAAPFRAVALPAPICRVFCRALCPPLPYQTYGDSNSKGRQKQCEVALKHCMLKRLTRHCVAWERKLSRPSAA
jgi:hypothetical protein